MTLQNPETPRAVLRRRDVEQATGLSRSTIYQQIADGVFPKPIRIGRRAVAWLVTDIESFISARTAGVGDDDLRAIMAEQLAGRAAFPKGGR